MTIFNKILHKLSKSVRPLSNSVTIHYPHLDFIGNENNFLQLELGLHRVSFDPIDSFTFSETIIEFLVVSNVGLISSRKKGC